MQFIKMDLLSQKVCVTFISSVNYFNEYDTSSMNYFKEITSALIISKASRCILRKLSQEMFLYKYVLLFDKQNPSCKREHGD